MSTTAHETTQSAELAKPSAKPKKNKEPAYRRKGSSDFLKPTLGGLIFRYILLALMTVIVVGPLVFQLATSFKGPLDDIYNFPPSLIPADPTFQNYVRVQDFIPIYLYAWHSLLVACGTVITNAAFATFGGYALGCMEFRGKKIVWAILLSTMLLPGEVTITSQFLTIKAFGLADSLWGVFLPGAVGAMNVMLIATACRAIPVDMLAAAIIDGATTWQRIRYMVWPNIKGMVSVVAIFSFIGAWDDFLWPLIVLTDPMKYTLTVGMAFLSGNFADPRLVAAGTMIALVPIVILFSVMQKHFFAGVEEGAVKG